MLKINTFKLSVKQALHCFLLMFPILPWINYSKKKKKNTGIFDLFLFKEESGEWVTNFVLVEGRIFFYLSITK